jgi:hypothetical protein
MYICNYKGIDGEEMSIKSEPSKFGMILPIPNNYHYKPIYIIRERTLNAHRIVTCEKHIKLKNYFREVLFPEQFLIKEVDSNGCR